MKKIKALGILFIMIILSGCVKYEVSMDIHKDKSMSFSLVYGLSTSSGMDISSMGMNIDEMKKNLDKTGYKVSKYKDDAGYSGLQITKEYKNIDDVSGKKSKKVALTDLLQKQEKFDDSQLFKLKKGLFSNKYSADFLFNLSNEENTDYSEYASSMTFKYKVTLPYKALKNNADEVSDDGKTLTWNIPYGGNKNIQYTFELKNNNLLIIIIICISLVIILGILAFLLYKKNKSNKVDNATINTIDDTVNNEVSEEQNQELNNNISIDNTNSGNNEEIKDITDPSSNEQNNTV